MKELPHAKTGSPTRSTSAYRDRTNPADAASLPEPGPHHRTARLRRAKWRHQAVDVSNCRLQQRAVAQLAVDGNGLDLRRPDARQDLFGGPPHALRQTP